MLHNDINTEFPNLTESEKQKLAELITYTQENSKYPFTCSIFKKLLGIDANRATIMSWLNNTDTCTPRKLLKKLDIIAKQQDDDVTFSYVGRALIRKPTDFNSPESVNRAKAKRLKTLRKMLGDEKIEELKQLSKYNRKQIEDWLNISGEIWSQERYTINYLLDILYFVASERDFNTLKLLHPYFPFLSESMALSRSQKQEIKEKTDPLSPAEIASVKLEILPLNSTEQESQELVETDDKGHANNQSKQTSVKDLYLDLDEVVIPIGKRIEQRNEVAASMVSPIAIQHYEIDNGSPMIEIRREYAPKLKSILDRLKAYVDRIDRKGMDHFKICFFKQTRTANRQINYNIAKELIRRIESAYANLSLQETLSDIFDDFYYSPTGVYMEMFHPDEVHTIRSMELNRIIKDALNIAYDAPRCGF